MDLHYYHETDGGPKSYKQQLDQNLSQIQRITYLRIAGAVRSTSTLGSNVIPNTSWHLYKRGGFNDNHTSLRYGHKALCKKKSNDKKKAVRKTAFLQIETDCNPCSFVSNRPYIVLLSFLAEIIPENYIAIFTDTTTCPQKGQVVVSCPSSSDYMISVF